MLPAWRTLSRQTNTVTKRRLGSTALRLLFASHPKHHNIRIMARKCRFCGGGPLTREHGWPRWLDNVLAKRVINQAAIPDDLVPRHRGKRNTVSGNEVRYVCRDCNSGWMSEIEYAAKPFVGPMAQGRGTILNRDAQTIVATWIVKTCFVHLFARPGDLDEKLTSQCREFGKTHLPLDKHYVSVAAFTGEKWATFSHFQPLAFVKDDRTKSTSEPIDGHVATILVGHFIGQAIHSPTPMWPKTKEGSWKLIWPDQSDFIWPPGKFLNPQDFEQAAKTPFPTIDPHPLENAYKWTHLP